MANFQTLLAPSARRHIPQCFPGPIPELIRISMVSIIIGVLLVILELLEVCCTSENP